MNQQLNGQGTENRSTHTLYTIFVPLNLNNGHPQPPERLERVQQMILEQAGGLTRFAPGQGFWVDGSNTTFVDQILPFQVPVPNCPEMEAWFVRQAAELARRLEQQAIFLFAQPVWLL